MVVDDLDVAGPVVAPREADAPLLVDPDAALSLSIARQRLEAIARKSRKIAEAGDAVQDLEPALGLLRERLELPDPRAVLQRLRLLAAKGVDHPLDPGDRYP
jgi:hypothetical protein